MAELEAKAGGSAPAAVSQKSKEFGPADVLAGPDIMAAAGSGAIAAPLSGLAGIAGSVLPGAAGQGADWQKSVQDALTFQPRTKVGETAMNALSKPFELLHKGAAATGRAAQDKLGFEPAGAAAVQTAVETLPTLGLMTLGARGKNPEVDAKASRNEVRDATYNAARTEGYKFPTSATNDSAVGARIEGTAGRPMLNQDMTLHNQTITNKIAAREAGLPENTAITPGRLEARRTQLAQPYREVAAIDALVAEDLQALREARADAKKWYTYADRTGNPVAEKRADKFSKKAEFLEGQIEDAARNSGKPDLVDRLRAARKEIAKTYDIEAALNEGSADVSAAKFGAMLDKGKPLSGGLETIAKAHQAFRPYMGNAASVRNPGVERMRGAIGIAANAAGAHGGIGWLAEGIPLAGGPIRSGIMTDWYQNTFGKPAYPGADISPGVLGAILQGHQNK